MQICIIPHKTSAPSLCGRKAEGIQTPLTGAYVGAKVAGRSRRPVSRVLIVACGPIVKRPKHTGHTVSRRTIIPAAHSAAKSYPVIPRHMPIAGRRKLQHNPAAHSAAKSYPVIPRHMPIAGRRKLQHNPAAQRRQTIPSYPATYADSRSPEAAA